MPEEEPIERAREDEREGKAPSTQAGEFVREEMEHIREGIIRLAELNQRRLISRDSFCTQSAHLFLDPGKCGFLLPSKILDVTRALGLGNQFFSYRRYCAIDHPL